MNLDLGTVAGVLGVALTVIFFIIGYRQTIGARKERAAAADREISETLLRRLTLESDFSVTYDDIERFISGKSLENRVKRSDVLSVEELWILLYSRVVSSDYLSAKQRKPILEKINRCFKSEESQDDLALANISAQQEVTKTKSRDEWLTALIGMISSLMAGISVVIAAKVYASSWTDTLVTSLKTPLFVGGILIISTATLLVLVYWLKEKASATRQEASVPFGSLKAKEFELRFIRRLQAAGINFLISREREVDIILASKNKRIAVELKLYPPNHRVTATIVRRMTDSLTKIGCEEGYLVIGTLVPERVQSESTAKVKIVSADEFFRIFIEAEKRAS